jgi:2-(1,2-epoxy-1,2-dihydrophenyl)acetyl-CoA isomerase
MTAETPISKSSEHIAFTREGAVAILRLNRTEKLNALTIEMHQAIFSALRTARIDPAIRVLVITGTGRAFCAGDDMGESDPRDGLLPPEQETEISWHNMVREMRSLPKPVIGAINGLACGAGSGLTLAADIRIAADTATFADIFTRRGIAGGAYLLTQAVGTAKSLELILTGDFIDAAEALRLGIFNRVVSADRLMEETLALANRLASGPAEAFGYSKTAVYQCANLALNEGLRVEEFAKLCCLRGAEVREGIAAFNDKRGAKFAPEREIANG